MTGIEARIAQELYEEIEACKYTLKMAGDKGHKLKNLNEDEVFQKIPRTPDGKFDPIAWSGINEEKQKEMYHKLSLVRDALQHQKQSTGYGAALIATAIFLPSAAMLLTVGIFLAEWSDTSAPLWGSLAALLAWLVVSILFREGADAKHAIPSSYGELLQRLDQLEAALKGLCPRSGFPNSQCNIIAYNEAMKQKDKIRKALEMKGLPWILASGYSHVWGRLYRAEEALIEVAPQEMVLEGAYYDELRLEGSKIENRDDLLVKLRKSVDSIDPGANKYLKTSAAVTPTAALAIGNTTLPEGTVATAYSETLFATGGRPPYRWVLNRGAIPDGLALNAAGVLSGTPTNSGQVNFTVQVIDNAGIMVEKNFPLLINKPIEPPTPLAISTISPLSAGRVDADYSERLLATGGKPPYKWEYDFGTAKPEGLDLGTSGVLNGRPTAPKTVNFTVQVTDSFENTCKKNFTLPFNLAGTITPLPVGNTESKVLARSLLRTVRSSINEYRDERWNGLIVARNRLLATFTLTSFAVFALLTIAIMSGADRSKVIAAIVFYLVGATVGLGNRLRGESQAEAAIADYGLSAARLITIPLFCGLGAIGGVLLMAMLPFASTALAPTVSTNQPPAISIVSLPAGTVATSYSDNKQKKPLPLAIKTTSPLAEGTVNTDYFKRLLAEGGKPPYTWKIISGNNPDGLMLSEAGELHGKPTTSNTYEFTVHVVDSTSTASIDRTLTLPISQPGQTKNKPAASGTTPPTLDDIFDFKKNLIGLFVAAIFGLTPGLLFDRLQQQADTYKSELKSSQATQGAQKT